MHNGSQVQDDGRQDDASKENFRRESFDFDKRPEVNYWCNRCNSAIGPRKKEPQKYISHENHVESCWPGGVMGIDYVECAMCKFAGSKITQHVANVHKLSKKEYSKIYGKLICSLSSKKYGSNDNCNWIERKKSLGIDLCEYRQKMSESVSKSILENSQERARRSRQLGKLNQRQDFRERSSCTARITSARPEIIEKRTENLRRWREENPEKFQEALTKILKKGSSRPEKILFEICKNIFGEETTSQFQIKHSSIPNKSCRARIDIANKNKNILVEFDGPFHFDPIWGQDVLDARIKRDLAIEKYAIKNGYLLIRVSYDMFDGKTFDEKVINVLNESNVCNLDAKILKVGRLYETSSI